jgi:hypothetical protein
MRLSYFGIAILAILIAVPAGAADILLMMENIPSLHQKKRI